MINDLYPSGEFNDMGPNVNTMETFERDKAIN